MKAISLWQPWASALFTDLKPDETRSWPLPSSLIGKEVAIQAAKRFTLDERMAFEIRVTPGSREIEQFRSIGVNNADDLPLGYILGTVIFASPVRTQIAARSDSQRLWGDYSPDRWAWPVVGRNRFANPVPFRGAQGFFNFQP